eukprot:jgi/Undpi1/2793/HiC_scaffold_14.g06170.m1
MMQEMVPTGPASREAGAAPGTRGEEGRKRQKNRNLPAEGGKRRGQSRPEQRRRSASPPPQPQSPPPPSPPLTSEVRAPPSVTGSVATERERDGDDLGAGRAAYGDDLETLERRRSEELKLIGEYDSATINPRRECWFIVDTKWLQCWAKFVRGEGPPPGRISNEALVKDDLKTPVEGLVSRVDYRGVNPAVWFLYLEMYGKDSAQDLCRYVIDLYEAEVPPKYRKEIYEEPMRRSQVEVQKMRWRVEPDEVRLPEKPRLCCCITEGTASSWQYSPAAQNAADAAPAGSAAAPAAQMPPVADTAALPPGVKQKMTTTTAAS